MDISENRRNFLKLMLCASVFTLAHPHKFLGKVFPNVEVKSNEIVVSYPINVNDYPDLKELWGSVYITLKAIDGSNIYIIAAHLDKNEYGVDYVALNEFCPHEGYPVFLLHPELKEFVCSGHGTVFDALGRYKSGPAAQDLERYPVRYEGGDIFYIELTFTDVLEQYNNLGYIEEIIPNPCSNNCLLNFVIEKPSEVIVFLYDSDGKLVQKLYEDYYFEGNHSIPINTSALNTGVYYIRLEIGNKQKIMKKLMVLK